MGALIRFVFLTSALFWMSSAHSEIYRCEGPDGTTSFSQSPCDEGMVKTDDGWMTTDQHRKKQEEAARKDRERIAAERAREEEAREKEQARKDKARQWLAEQEARKKELKERMDEYRQEAIQSAEKNGNYVVEYVVEGTSTSASLTYSNESGGTEQLDVKLPWRDLFFANSGFSAYISAQNNNKVGSITVKILLNGIEVKQSTSSGAYVIASASGRI